MDVHQTSSVLDEMSSTLANDVQMVDNVMTIELTNATGTYLHQLNEDCLLEIFSRNSLTPMDLCNLAETCKLFKQITQRMFPNGFAIKRSYTGCMYTFSSKNHSELECTFQDIERILKNFGRHLFKLCVGNDSALFVNLIARYCDDITLKHLEMRHLKGTELVLARLQLDPILQRLPQLCVLHCKLPIEPWNMNWDSLIELEISYCKNIAALLSNSFPILERFCFCSDYAFGSTELTRRKNDIEALSEFVGRHGCLKKIEIFGDSSHDICKLLHAISCSCTELVEVTLANLGFAFFDISHLQNLAKLKVLHIGSSYGPIEHTTHCEAIDFSQAFKSLKTVGIFFGQGPYVGLKQIFDVLSRLQGLRELKLGHPYDSKLIPWERLTQLRKVYLSEVRRQSDLLDIIRLVIRQLINLEELELGYYYRLDREEFSKIVEIVESRAHVLTLICNYDFNYEENCDGKGKVKLIKKTKP